MRLLLFPLLLLSGVLAAPRPAPPRPLVVLVHGRGQLGSDSALLRREWKRDLDTALAAAGFPALRDEDVRLAWYADVMDPSVSGACDRGYATEAGLGDLARGFLVSLVSLIPDTVRGADRDARALIGDMLYFVDPSTRCAAGTRLGNALASARVDRRPVIVVAYSLGAAVAYDYLDRARGRDSLEVHLVTIGSPLGVPIARELLTGDGQLRVPRGVASWTNVYDPDDSFAAPLALGDRAVNRRVRSPAVGDPHWVGRYLRDRETGAALADALCAASRDARPAQCPAPR